MDADLEPDQSTPLSELERLTDEFHATWNSLLALDWPNDWREAGRAVGHNNYLIGLKSEEVIAELVIKLQEHLIAQGVVIPAQNVKDSITALLSVEGGAVEIDSELGRTQQAALQAGSAWAEILNKVLKKEDLDFTEEQTVDQAYHLVKHLRALHVQIESEMGTPTQFSKVLKNVDEYFKEYLRYFVNGLIAEDILTPHATMPSRNQLS